MENHHFQWVNPLQMYHFHSIFNSYVKLPEGISNFTVNIEQPEIESPPGPPSDLQLHLLRPGGMYSWSLLGYAQTQKQSEAELYIYI